MVNKYKVSSKENRTWNDKTYASKAEMIYAQHIGMLKKAGEVSVCIEQPKVWLGVPECKYVPDFFVVYEDGKYEFIDVKGNETAKFKRDKKLWKAYGDCPLRIVKLTNYSKPSFKTVQVIAPN